MISTGTAPGDSPKNQVTKSVHRPRAILQNLNGNNTSNNSSPNTPRFAGSHPSFASLKAGDAELPEATSEQAPATAAIKLVLLYNTEEIACQEKINNFRTISDLFLLSYKCFSCPAGYNICWPSWRKVKLQLLVK